MKATVVFERYDLLTNPARVYRGHLVPGQSIDLDEDYYPVSDGNEIVDLLKSLGFDVKVYTSRDMLESEV